MLPTGKKAGGAPINFVYHASRLGAERYAISAVGDDGLGREILEELDNNSIRYLIEKVPYPTGTVQVTLQDGVPDYIINERVAWDHLSPTSNAIDLAERADSVPHSQERRYKRFFLLPRTMLIVVLTSICVSIIIRKS